MSPTHFLFGRKPKEAAAAGDEAAVKSGLDFPTESPPVRFSRDAAALRRHQGGVGRAEEKRRRRRRDELLCSTCSVLQLTSEHLDVKTTAAVLSRGHVTARP